MESPIYLQCPTVFSCVFDDALALIDWKAVVIGILVWLVAFFSAYRKRQGGELGEFLTVTAKSLVAPTIVYALLFLFVALIYSPWRRYDALKTYAKGLTDAPPKTVYQDQPETVKKLKALTEELDKKIQEAKELKIENTQLRDSRQLQRIALRPNISVGFYYTPGGSGWRLTNPGPGLGVIKWFSVFVDKLPKPNWREFAQALGIRGVYTFLIPHRNSNFAPNLTNNIFWITSDEAEKLKQQSTRVDMAICYCSLAGDCWIKNSSTDEPESSSCKTVPKVVFGNNPIP
jgi:hypothetical protein